MDFNTLDRQAPIYACLPGSVWQRVQEQGRFPGRLELTHSMGLAEADAEAIVAAHGAPSVVLKLRTAALLDALGRPAHLPHHRRPEVLIFTFLTDGIDDLLGFVEGWYEVGGAVAIEIGLSGIY